MASLSMPCVVSASYSVGGILFTPRQDTPPEASISLRSGESAALSHIQWSRRATTQQMSSALSPALATAAAVSTCPKRIQSVCHQIQAIHLYCLDNHFFFGFQILTVTFFQGQIYFHAVDGCCSSQYVILDAYFGGGRRVNDYAVGCPFFVRYRHPRPRRASGQRHEQHQERRHPANHFSH